MSFKVVRFDTNLLPVIDDELNTFKNMEVEYREYRNNEIKEKDYDADALMVISSPVKEDLINRMDNLKVIVRIGIGTDKIDIETAEKAGIPVANVPDFCKSELADHTFALLLNCSRKILQQDRTFRTGDYWSVRISDNIRRISGKVLGLVGFGSLSQAVAKRARAFDLNIQAYDPYAQNEDFEKYDVKRCESLDEVLSSSDFLSLHIPLTKNTFHLIGKRELSLMKPEAILINTSRGGVVDEVELIKALQEKRILGAGLDVFEAMNLFEESPVLKSSPFFELENVVITPHSAASSKEAYDEVRKRAAEEVARVFTGTEPLNIVNRKLRKINSEEEK